MVTEENIVEIREKIFARHKKNPKAMFAAFCLVFVDNIVGEFKEFVDGLELSDEDKLEIFKGIIERKYKFWENGDLEDLYDISCKILKEYDVQVKGQKKKNGLAKSKS